MIKHAAYGGAAALALLGIMAPTGGYPAKPVFQKITVSPAGAAITGNSTLAGTLTGLTGLTVASGGAQIAGNTNVTGGTFSSRGFADNATAPAITIGATGTTYHANPSSAGPAIAIASIQYPWAIASQVGIDVGTGGAIRGDVATTLGIDSNQYYGTGNFIYKTTGPASEFNVNTGAFSWTTAPSGTAGAVATQTTRMSLSNTGILAVNSVNVPKLSYGECNSAGGLSATAQNSNVTSCVNSSTGTYAITFTVGYASAPLCLSTLAGATGVSIANGISGTTATIQTATNGGVLANALVNFSCMGT